jgi:hypothetical protein
MAEVEVEFVEAVDAHTVVIEDMDTAVTVPVPAPARLEDSCWVADAKREPFHFAVAARIEEGSRWVATASLEHIREVAHYALYMFYSVEGKDCCLCGCAEEAIRGGGGGASGHVSFLVISGFALFRVLALALCLYYTYGL